MGGDEVHLPRRIIEVLATPELEYPQRAKALLRVLTAHLPISEATLYLKPLAPGVPPQILRAGTPGFFSPEQRSCMPRGAGWHPLDQGGTLTLEVDCLERSIGYLCLHEIEPDRLPAGAKEDLDLICRQIGWMTLCNERMQHKIQQAEHLHFVAQISRQLNQAQTVDEMLRELLGSLVRENKALFAIVQHNKPPPPCAQPLFEIDPNFRALRETLLAKAANLHKDVVLQKRPVLDEKIAQGEHPENAPPFAALCLPLVFNNQMLGTLTLYSDNSPTSNPFASPEMNRRLFQDLSIQVAEAWGRISALDRLATVSKENQRKLLEISFLYHVSEAMHGAHGMDDLVHFILSAAVVPDGVGCDRALLFMINERSRFLQGMLGVVREQELEQWAPSLYQQPVTEHLIPEEIQQKQKTSAFNRLVQQQRVALDDPFNPIALAARNSRTLSIEAPSPRDSVAGILRLGPFICVPLQGRKKTVAVLVVDNSRSKHLFNPEEMRFLELFANQAGAAMENAALLQQLRTTHTELRATQEDLLQTEKLATIGEIAASVAHELKNPLVCVGGFAQRLLKNVPEGSRAGEYATIIAREVRRVEEMLTNILSFSKRQMMCFAPCNLIEIIGSALNLLSRELAESNIEIVQNLDPDLPPVIGDEKQLRQVLINLIGNAREAMADGGTLTLAARCSTLRGDPAVTIEVADTGGGIAPESLRNIFNPFFTTKQSGTGLGLSISHRIIEHHQGTIEVFNSEQGATFVIQLPLGHVRHQC
ncbi:ATP-binding protein [Geoalkalibacter subterraneus]|uniref:ATP-binding protein n=1 Tax=Geoalkalibacter subterraneus TaxID=483547 RepID=UPI000694CE92|nr:ATP-binding protein [Geoalkalibacter subterraneus]